MQEFVGTVKWVQILQYVTLTVVRVDLKLSQGEAAKNLPNGAAIAKPSPDGRFVWQVIMVSMY